MRNEEKGRLAPEGGEREAAKQYLRLMSPVVGGNEATQGR